MSTSKMAINDKLFTFNDLAEFLEKNPVITISKECRLKIEKSRNLVEKILKSDLPVYGVNTGFGKFSEVRIDSDQVEELQKRLVYSHSTGTGEVIPPDIARLIMLLKIKSLSLGHSGCRLIIVEQLIQMLNHQIIPVIPQKGSVGASGDLAPLAHLALAMMGEGRVFSAGKKGWHETSAKRALTKAGLTPVSLAAKEGLAILNGTQVSTAYAVYTFLRAENLIKSADIIGALTLESLLGTLTAFDARIQKVRMHRGQQLVAANFRKILRGSPIVASHRYDDERVQDAYSLRCIPQVHGAVRDALQYIKNVLHTEINSVTDNPLVFPEKGDVISGGNFHAAPVGYVCDLLGIALADLAGISERRIEHMQDPTMSFLPAFLVQSGGLNCGLMIAHVTAAALTSENKVLAHPASVDSIPTSANKEDHVSMAAHAARKACQIAENLETILAIELVAACQALDLRAPLLPAKGSAAALDTVRTTIPFLKDDRQMYQDIENARQIIRSGLLIRSVEKVVGTLH